MSRIILIFVFVKYVFCKEYSYLFLFIRKIVCYTLFLTDTRCSRVTDVHARIFCLSYSDTSWDFNRYIEEENLEFQNAIHTCFEIILSLEPTSKNHYILKKHFV